MKNIGIMISALMLVICLCSTGFSTEEKSLTERYMEQQKLSDVWLVFKY